ncbi:MAG: carboxypeptidase regulatory-like domain-containing protein, partial [Gemmatimonadaceae bacterium]|nr:carboxypeptidase regulatory-like domain-containing protein [Gemmatimonadaceae bacterium]
MDAPSPTRRWYREARLHHFAVGVIALLSAHLPRVATAQAPRAGQAASVSGIVFDSIALKPLTAARVELVNADSVSAPARTVDTDTLGHFRFADVRPGRYLVGFLHPMLDSIGVESTPRAITVEVSDADMRVDLALPSSRSLRLAICGATAVIDSSALIIGVVRDATTRSALASSNVRVEWADLTIGVGGLKRSIARRTYDTQETGWFALCGAPAGGTILLSASHGSDSTEALELEIPASAFLRRDLFFGAARDVAADTAAVARVTDSLTLRGGPRRAGDG